MRKIDVMDALGWPQSAVSKFESGERRLDLLELEDLCRNDRDHARGFVRLQCSLQPAHRCPATGHEQARILVLLWLPHPFCGDRVDATVEAHVNPALQCIHAAVTAALRSGEPLAEVMDAVSDAVLEWLRAEGYAFTPEIVRRKIEKAKMN